MRPRVHVSLASGKRQFPSVIDRSPYGMLNTEAIADLFLLVRVARSFPSVPAWLARALGLSICKLSISMQLRESCTLFSELRLYTAGDFIFFFFTNRRPTRFFFAWVVIPLKKRILPAELTKVMKLIKEATTTQKTRGLRKQF